MKDIFYSIIIRYKWASSTTKAIEATAEAEEVGEETGEEAETGAEEERQEAEEAEEGLVAVEDPRCSSSPIGSPESTSPEGPRMPWSQRTWCLEKACIMKSV